MKKLNINDFTKMMPPKQGLGGSVAKSIQKQSEALPGPALEAGGPLISNIPQVTINATPNPIVGPQVKGVKSEDVIAVILVIGVLGLAGWAAYKIINSSSNNSKKES